MDFNLDGDDVNFCTVPAGSYCCCIAEVRTGTTRAGDERWSLRLVVAEGPHVGKRAAWDSMVFSNRGRARVRLIFQALGLPSTGRVQIEPGDIEGRKVIVDIRPVKYTSPSGHVVIRNEVPHDGWHELPAKL